MAIKVNGTTVIDDSRELSNISSVDATTVSALNSAGIVSDIVADTTPQLGGDLDLNSSNITGTGDVNITGSVTATSFSGDGSSLTGIQAPAYEVIQNIDFDGSTTSFTFSDLTAYAEVKIILSPSQYDHDTTRYAYSTLYFLEDGSTKSRDVDFRNAPGFNITPSLRNENGFADATREELRMSEWTVTGFASSNTTDQGEVYFTNFGYGNQSGSLKMNYMYGNVEDDSGFCDGLRLDVNSSFRGTVSVIGILR